MLANGKEHGIIQKIDESMYQAVQRESKAARESAGILDASTLGKIDIQGTDASEFLNRSLYKCLVKTSYR